MSEKQQLQKTLERTGSARKAAEALNVSVSTVIRRMREFGLKVRSRGRPQKRLGDGIRFTTHEELAEENVRYWRRQSAEARFLAVEEIANETHRLYHGRFPTLERIHRISDGPAR